MALLILILKISRNKIFSTLQTLWIWVLPKKDNNIEEDKSGDNSSTMTIKRSDRAGDKNLVLRAGFLTVGAKIIFAQLKKAFIEALILYYFEPDWYIKIKTNIIRYVIKNVLN